jgi:CBS domain-containing protein
MIVASILNSKGRTVRSVAPEMSVRDAARYLTEHGIGAAMVLDAEGGPAGIFSERDFLRAVAEKGGPALAKTVGDLMTRDLAVCTPTDSIDAVMATMTNRRCRHLPVVDEGKVVGVVSIGDVVKSRIAEAETEAQALKAYIASG